MENSVEKERLNYKNGINAEYRKKKLVFNPPYSPICIDTDSMYVVRKEDRIDPISTEQEGARS